MQLIASSLMIEKRYGHHALVDELCHLFPEGKRETKGEIYAWCLPDNIASESQIFQYVLSTIERHGLHRRKYQEPRDRKAQYTYTEKRIYSDEDFQCCEWLRLDPKKMISVNAAMDERLEGLCALKKNSAPKSIPYCYINSGGLCPIYLGRLVKEALEQSDLRGYRIKPTFLYLGNDYVENPEIWELASQYYFPDKLPNPTPRIHPEEYHYVRSSIAHLENVDVVYESERFNQGEIKSQIIVSKGFYDWWNENNFKHLDFIPCRIVDDPSEVSSPN